MKNPKRTFLDLTWVGWINILLLQWLWLRLGYGDKWRIIYGVMPLIGWSKNGNKKYEKACLERHFDL